MMAVKYSMKDVQCGECNAVKMAPVADTALNHHSLTHTRTHARTHSLVSVKYNTVDVLYGGHNEEYGGRRVWWP